MLIDYELTFPSGSLITGQLLQKMYEYPKNLINYIFADYSEGVISGLKISYQDQKLILSPGIYKHNSSLYIMEHKEIIKENVNFTGKKWYVVLRNNDSNELCSSEENGRPCRNNIILRKLEIEVKESTELRQEELEKKIKDHLLLFSFKNEPRFPKMGDDITNDAYILDYQHSCRGTEPTFMPELFDLIYKKLLSKKMRHPFDYVIMGEICTKGVIPCELMRAYISCLPDHASTSELRGKKLMEKFWNALSNLKGNGSDNAPENNAPLMEDEDEEFILLR